MRTPGCRGAIEADDVEVFVPSIMPGELYEGARRSSRVIDNMAGCTNEN
jgi:hypothetical protein